MFPPTLIVLAAACLLVRFSRLSGQNIQKYRLKQLAVITLIVAASTPTTDLLNDVLLAVPLFAVYLAYDWIASRYRFCRRNAA